MISASVVLYNSTNEEFAMLYESCHYFLLLGRLIVVDHSQKPCVDVSRFSGIEYYHMPQNPGFGAGHNFAIRKIINESRYHFVLNPDVSFPSQVIQNIIEFMDVNTDIGQIMPKVLNPDGSLQHLCRLLPTPINLFSRRFMRRFINRIVDRYNDNYQLSFWNHDSIEDVPILSGCFMVIRTSVLKLVGLFDTRFFMYLEDYDLTRRIGEVSRTVYYPEVAIVHNHAQASYHNLKTTSFHLVSAVRYFNKWGWFFDKKRSLKNKQAIIKLRKTNTSTVS